MSIIQSIIGSAVEVNIPPPPPPPPVYPVPGSNYTTVFGTSAPLIVNPVSGYYEASSVGDNPQVGLWRRAYQGLAVSTGALDPNFPASYTLSESLLDPYVGFGSQADGATNYSMEWIGYFKPAVTGNFVFSANIDDYMYMWIGQNAVSGFTTTYPNYVLENSSGSNGLAMIAGLYYPVRIRYTEIGGANACDIRFALSGEPLLHNQLNASIGQFYVDGIVNNGAFPASGLIT
jgi:hypothetical protein